MMAINSVQDFLDLVNKAVAKDPENLSIDLRGNNLGAVGAPHIATALKSGQCPANLSINLRGNNLDAAGAQHIADALKSGQCPANLSIVLWGNNLGAAGAQHIADALMQTKIPEGLKLHNKIMEKTLEKILVEKIERVIGDATTKVEGVSQAINAGAALNGLFPDNKRWSVNPLESLYPRYFQLKLAEIRNADFSNSDNIQNLESLFNKFHQRAKELNYPKTYRWQSLFEVFSKTFSELSAQSTEQETAHKGQLFRFKNAKVLEEIKLKGVPTFPLAAIRNLR